MLQKDGRIQLEGILSHLESTLIKFLVKGSHLV